MSEKITFGACYRGVRDPYTVTEFAQTIESLGFDVFWIGDRPTNRDPCWDPFIAMAYAAAATKHIKVGSGVALLPLYHPVRLAQTVTTLDVFSGGRCIMGVGIGGEFPKQFEAFNVPLHERGRRTDEYIEILVNLWTQPVSSYQGEFFSYEDIVLEPKAVQRPHPPIWVGGRLGGVATLPDGTKMYRSRTAAVRRAAKYGQGWLPFFLTLDRFAESVDLLKKYAEEFGRDLSQITIGLDNHWWIRDDLPTGSRIEGVAKFDIVGNHKDVVRQAEAFVEAGARHFMCNWMCPPAELAKQLELVARHVIPHFK